MGINMGNDIRVQILLRKNDLALVQWTEGNTPSRAWVTPDMIVSEDGKEAIVTEPKAGIPYGVEWSRLVTFHATPQEFERQLKMQGIWTVADLREHPDGVRSALQATYGIDATALGRAVRDL